MEIPLEASSYSLSHQIDGYVQRTRLGHVSSKNLISLACNNFLGLQISREKFASSYIVFNSFEDGYFHAVVYDLKVGVI